MSGLKQPLVGIVATALVMAVALGFVSLFSFPMFTGWVAYFLLGCIPIQIITAVTWGSSPGFAQSHRQPIKGLILTLTTLVVGVLVTAVTHATIGGAISPPTPMLAMCAIVSVVVTFWAAIMWGGWPFTTLIKNPIAAGLTMLVVCYLVNYALFRIFFDYGFMQGAPVYVAAQDPHGLFPAWNALVFYLSCLSAMFLMLNFDLWPLTMFPGVMRQPVLGAVWTVAAIVLGGLVFYIGVIALGTDVVAFMVRVPVPFIFGSIVVLNMLQGSLFAKYQQPMKGILNTVAVVVIGQVLSRMYGALAPTVTGPVAPGPPTYDFEIWLASALLSVTFPLLIFYAEYFKFWPLKTELPARQ
ncbi:MAG: hypothetical protein ABJA98_02140 [Acidobacteriota bacterium]